MPCLSVNVLFIMSQFKAGLKGGVARGIRLKLVNLVKTLIPFTSVIFLGAPGQEKGRCVPDLLFSLGGGVQTGEKDNKCSET
jgi:hypothetical protein